MSARPLVGLILTSSNPERLAEFYRTTLDIPFEMAQHGNLREHIECEANGIHFAILKKANISPTSNITPSFFIHDLSAFLESLAEKGVMPLHRVIDLGEGKRVSTIADPDGNTIRLIEISA